MAAKLDVTMDASQVEAAYRKLQAENAKLRTALGGLGVAGEEAGRAIGGGFRAIQQAAAAARTAATGPADALRAEITKLDAAMKQGLIGPQEYGRAIDQAGAKFGAAAGPVDQYALRIEALRAKLAAGQITQAQHDAGLAVARNAATQAADGAGRYQIALVELDRRLKAGELSQAGYSAALGELRTKTLAASTPADAFKIKLAELGRQLDAGKLSAQTYDTAVAKLAADSAAIKDPLARMQVGVAAVDDQLRRGVIDAQQHSTQVGRLRAEYEQSSSPIDRYKVKLSEAEDRLRSGQITGQQYEARVRELRKEFGESTSAADRYRAQVEALNRSKASGKITTDQYKTAVKQAREETTQLYGAAPPAIGAIASQLTGLVGGMLSVGGIVSQIRAAMEEAKQLREEQFRKQLTVGEAQGETVKMLGKVTTPEATAFLQSVQAVGTQAGFQDTAALYLAAADTLSATASDQQMTLAILQQAAPIFKNRPQQIGEFAGAVADLATIQGAKTDAEIKGVISEVLSITSQARITNLAAFKEAAAAIAGATVTDTGGDRGRAVRESGAAFAAIGGAIKDPTGALTKTATSMLATQLERLLPEKDIMGPVSEQMRAELLREKAQLQEKVAAFDAGGGDAKRAADLVKLEADAKWARSLETKATASAAAAQVELAKPGLPADDRKRLTATSAEQTASAERHAARAAQLEQQLQQRRSTMSAAALADAAEVDLARKRMARIDQEMTGTIRKGTGAKTLAERMSIVQNDAELQRLFFEGDTQQGIGEAAFRGPIEPVIRELLTRKDSEAARRFDTAKGAISADTGTYDQLVANLREASPQLRLVENVSAGKATTEEFDLNAGAAGNLVDFENQLNATLSRTRSGWRGGFRQATGELIGSFERSGESDPQRRMEMGLRDLLLRRRDMGAWTLSAAAREEQTRANLPAEERSKFDAMQGPYLKRSLSYVGSDEDREQVAKLDEAQRKQIEYLDKMLQKLAVIADATGESRDAATKRPAIGASAAAAVPSSQRLGR